MSANGVRIDPRVIDLLRDAARWRLLGRLLECPDRAWRRDIAALAGEVDDAELRTAAEAAAGATEGTYHSMFGPGGPAPPREASYHDTLELGSLMSNLVRCYDAFGYRPASKEPPDHIAVEVGFLSYLRLKEAFAVMAGDGERAAITAAAAARFRADHLAVIAAPLAAVLTDSGIAYLTQASMLLASRIGDPPPRRRVLALIDGVDDKASEFPCCGG